MSFKKNLCIYDISSSVFLRYFRVSLFFTLAVFHITTSEKCINSDPCQCVFKNGSVVDLTSLGDPSGPRFENFRATVKKDNYTYYYNPCYSFKYGQGEAECAKGVAVCQVLKEENLNFDIGVQASATFEYNSIENFLHLIYKSARDDKTTNVKLVCSEHATTPKLVVEGEVVEKSFKMTLTSRCACPNLCRKSLSAGSVLVIIFMIFVSLYLILGIVHSSLTRGAKGWELIPNYEFWSDFPLLVRDGCVFVVNGCKTETAYERI